MEIPRKYIENYNDAINEIAERARGELEGALRGIDYSADVSAIREATVSVMERYCGASSTLSARLAAEFYDGLRAEMVAENDGFKAEIRSAWDPDATRGGVEAIAETLVKVKGNTDGYIRQCLDRLDYETRRAANQCIFLNSRKDPREPRYARVPAGMETCDFCIMLASNGFVYKGADLASHSHAHCDCVVVPSWDKKNPAVQGYDPDKYYRIWKKLGSIDKMDGLRYGEKKALRLCAIDSEIPIAGEQRRAFADALGGCLDRAKKEYKREKTIEQYEACINRLLGQIGGMYGMELKGQFLSGRGKASATPSGDEVWAVVQRRDIWKSVVFQGYIEGRGGDADILADGIYADIKTPRHLSKVGKRLNHGAAQCRAMGQEEGIVLLSDLRFEDDFGEAIKIATEFVENGTLRTVYLVSDGDAEDILHSASSMEEHRSPKPTTEVRSLGGVPLGTNENKSRGLSDSRDMASGMRRDATRILTPEDIVYVSAEAESIDIPTDILAFNEGTSTSFNDATGVINVRGDVFPDRTSTENRDRLSVRATLAHEYYGHRRYRGTLLRPGDWRDEFRASYRAAIDTPNLSAEDRAMLMVDAYQRASDAGVTLKYSREYTRIVYGYE